MHKILELRQRVLRIIFFIGVLVLLFGYTPYPVMSAEDYGSSVTNSDTIGGSAPTNPSTVSGSPAPNPSTVDGAPAGGSAKLVNPLKSQSIMELILKVIDILLVFALPIIILYIMYAGFLFVTAAGNSEKIGSAKNALLSAIIGGVIVLGARVIVDIIQGTITAL
jgi:hypothetical protein